jgi:hypothetical protein
MPGFRRSAGLPVATAVSSFESIVGSSQVDDARVTRSTEVGLRPCLS